MSTSGRTGDGNASAASDVAAVLGESAFVRVLTRADGDCLAAAGLLAHALREQGVPYQVRVARFGATSEASAESDDTIVTVGLDCAADATLESDATPASVTAFDAANELEASPDVTLALAGVIAGGHPPGAGESAHLLESGGFEQRPGVGIPTDDLADGLAHTTLAHADYSGDAGAVQATLAELGLPAELDESAHRKIASEFALATIDAPQANARAADAVERALRPHETPAGPFATLEGYADVLDSVARERPGTGVALALGHEARDPALAAWRDHAQAAHAALAEGTTGRYDGLFVLRTEDAPVETVARLLRDFRSPEPIALVVGDGVAAAAASEDCGVGATMSDAAGATEGTGGGTARRGYAEFDTDTKEFLGAFREARR
ncbi:exonuclease RecJ [Halorussus halophilus]|uniref:exonuclease RecJ n=1 Tax=Halorussus halophilus TaxID=2650975 RepID=UPI0013018981|nr:exonuclease RecJ [Halorussus halophilus]